ncbi:hypothetical protein FE784_07420 [Paenibacillus hemerocallicola]|uniref:Uncharacterized protein n=1 Tax=Paenibacillus hemerocallicola TaxID=1172614 RepID=A0A5C4TEV2_9BACL|nr:hypothetical protein [Paenibacillus hemerocallicola]TNJ67020.1 hypothetical protein FE784_07420 [Paenibacillus hemerocallicola]
MVFHSQSPNHHPKSASPVSSSHSQHEVESTGSAELGEGVSRGLPLSAGHIMQLQRTIGNQAVQRMLSGITAQSAEQRANDRKINRMQAAGQQSVGSTTAHSAVIRRAGEAAAAVPQSAAAPRTPGDLRNKGEYHTIYKWLKSEAERSGKTALFGYFDSLDPGQKMTAIRLMADNARYPDLSKVKETMITGFIRKSFDWNRFSEVSREANKTDTANYNADQARDYASYAAIGTSSAAGGTGGSAKISTELGARGALPVSTNVAPVAAGLSGLASVSQMYNASQNYDSSLSTADKAQLVVGEGGGGAADFARFAAGAADGPRAVASGAATAAAGVGAIVGGAAYMVGGVVGYREGRKNAAKLEQLERGFNEKAGDERAEKLGHAANLGASTQHMNKNKSAATAAKGALMVVGGAVMLAAAASPIGPMLIAAAAILGGIAAIIKFYKKSKRKEAFVDKVLGTEQETAKPENAGLGKEKVRQKLMESRGFNSVDQCYAQIVTDLAGMLFDGGVKGEDEECKQIVEAMGLKIDKKKQKPSKEMIAKKLHT